MIKGKSPFPFERIALAVAFSPRLEQLIAETARLRQLFASEVIFIHVGKKTSEKQRQLSSFLNSYGFSDANSKVFWEQGNLADAITRVCKSEIVDLLVLGALQKENMLSYYMGSVSREVARKSKCSVLLLTEPENGRSAFRQIVVNGHDHRKTPHTLNTAAYIAEKENTPDLTVVTEIDVPVLSMSLADDAPADEMRALREQLLQEEEIRYDALRKSLVHPDREIRFVTLSGRSGHSIGQYARAHHTDLLVVNSPDHSLSIFDRIFTHDIEYLLSDLPCNLLIVHSRFSDHDTLVEQDQSL